MTTPTPDTIALGEPQSGVSFDSAFEVARRVRDTFECRAVTFGFNGTTVTVDQFTTASEAFEAFTAARR